MHVSCVLTTITWKQWAEKCKGAVAGLFLVVAITVQLTVVLCPMIPNLNHKLIP